MSAIVMSSVGAGGPRATSNSGNLHHADAARPAQALRRPDDPGVAAEAGADPGHQRLSAESAGHPRRRHFTKSQYQYTLQSLDLHALYDTAGKLVDALAKTPGFQDVTSDMDLSSPTVNVEIDRDRAASLGISAQQIEQALASSFGSQQISTIYTASTQYRGDPRAGGALSARCRGAVAPLYPLRHRHARRRWTRW